LPFNGFFNSYRPFQFLLYNIKTFSANKLEIGHLVIGTWKVIAVSLTVGPYKMGEKQSFFKSSWKVDGGFRLDLDCI
jgi:hypothetical protein